MFLCINICIKISVTVSDEGTRKPQITHVRVFKTPAAASKTRVKVLTGSTYQ